MPSQRLVAPRVLYATLPTAVVALCNTDEACGLLALVLLSFAMIPTLLGVLALTGCFAAVRSVSKAFAIIAFCTSVGSLLLVSSAGRYDMSYFSLAYLMFGVAFMWQAGEHSLRLRA